MTSHYELVPREQIRRFSAAVSSSTRQQHQKKRRTFEQVLGGRIGTARTNREHRTKKPFSDLDVSNMYKRIIDVIRGAVLQNQLDAVDDDALCPKGRFAILFKS